MITNIHILSIGGAQHQVIRNLSAVLEAAGSSLKKIVKINIFLDDMDNFTRMNEVYTQYFTENLPCRT